LGLVVATDLDGTVLDLETYSYEGVREAAGALAGLGVPVVVVTSKTLWEAWLYWRRLGFRGPGGPLVVFEVSGGAAGGPGSLAWWDWVDPETGLHVASLAPPLAAVEGLVERSIPPGCRGRVVRLSRADPGLVGEILGLPRSEAALASRRLYDEALWSPDRGCLEEAARRASLLGLTVRWGARVLHLTGARGGKAWALRLLAGRLSPRLRGETVVALGDSPSDADMLEEADYAVVVPHRGGRVGVSPRRGDYLVAPEPAPRGWVWAVREVLLRLWSGGSGPGEG
jgi:mannosyl-3-phosphoglycerate phosphatase